MNTADALVSSPQIVAGRYRIDARIARGGMAEVYAATDISTDTKLALKVLRADVAEDARIQMLFRLEFHTLRGIDHPNIIEVYEYGMHGGRAFYTMELLDGSDLSKIAPLSPDRACSYLRDVATSLSLLHHRRLLHRDVSPRNVRVTADGHCKLLDFGAMAHFGPATDVVGTPPLVAPECLRGGSLDHRTDLFALGGLAYYLLTGKHAYYARTFPELAELWAKPVVPPSAYNAEVSLELDELVLGLLKLEPNARPSSAAFVIDRLTSLANLPLEEPVEAGESFLDSTVLAGRQRELEKLRAALQEAQQGRGSALMIESNPGVGKSRLLRELAAEAQLTGALVAEVDARTTVGTHATVRALCLSLMRAAPTEARRAFSPYLTTLGHILPELLAPGAELAELPLEPLVRRGAIQQALVLAFGLLMQERVIVLLIDDIDRADDVSLLFLRALARNASRERLLLAASQTLASALLGNQALASFNRSVRHLRLHRLRREGTHELVRGLFGEVPNVDRVAAFLHETTTGHPAQLMQVLRHLVEIEQICYVGGTWSLPATMPSESVPQSMVDTLRARLGRLQPGARHLVELMALYDGTIPLAVLSAASGMADEPLFSTLQELMGAGIVVASADSHRLSQDAFRTAMEAELSQDRARELHEKLARALLAQPQLTSGLEIRTGLHLILAGRELEGAKKLDAAARRVTIEGLNMMPAARAVEAALSVYERQQRPLAERLRLRIKLVQWSPFTDPNLVEHYADDTLALLYEQSGLALAERLQPRLGKLLGLIVGIVVAGVRNRFAPKARRGLSMLGSLVGFLRVLTPAIAVRAIRLDSPGVHALERYVPVLAAFTERSSGHGVYLYCRAQVLHFRGHVEQAKQTFQEYLALLSKPGHMRETPTQERIELRFAGRVALAEACMRQADPLILELIEHIDEDDAALARVTKAQMRAMYHMVRGEWAQAQAAKREFEHLSADVGDVWQLEQIMVPFSGLVAAISGDTVELKRVVERLRTLAKDAPSLERVRRWFFNYYRVLHGRAASVIDAIERDAREMAPLTDMLWLDQQASLAIALLSLGNATRALEVCQRACEQARGEVRVTDITLVSIHWVWAEAEITLGRPSAAKELLDRLLEEIESLQSPLLMGRSYGERALAQRALGDVGAYEQDLASMRMYYERGGHPVLLAQAERFAAVPVPNTLRLSQPPSASDTSDSEATQSTTPSSRRNRSTEG